MHSTVLPALPVEIVLRRAEPADATVLARHCVEMYADIGVLPPECRTPLLAEAEAFIAAALPREEDVAWVAAPAAGPGLVVSGAGLHLRPGLPRLRQRRGATAVTSGPQAVVCNVYTEHGWRRRGLATALLRALLALAEKRDVPQVFLHASIEGRPLYERLGFVPTNEMRYAGAPVPAT